MRFHVHALRGWLVGRRLGRERWVSGQMTTLSWLGRGTLLLLAFVMVLGDDEDQKARAKGLMPVQIEPLPAFVGAHSCISPSDVDEPPPEPEEPPCPRKGKRPDAR
ncbi:hypothetical protein [Polyangium sp. 15x6]|uniref:hypothetical protein n=1 Tax=Polyangium sp. 15x6 TaxID=3042687 RepID=UPI00249C86E3|nr:hypothetical protein [Polyangium sp. 15x6]MDI3289794.1 hypothetical protein [Polyangium sp. 15x6]